MENEETAVEMGFVPVYEPLNTDQVQDLMDITIMDAMTEELGEVEVTFLPFTVQILDKRVSVLNLPISFTMCAKLTLASFTKDHPASMMAALIDCLNEYEGIVIGLQEIVNLYPKGFYTEESVKEYVYNYLKPGLCKWSHIY